MKSNDDSLPNRTSPFFTKFLCVSQLYENSSCSSGFRWDCSAKASPKALCVCTTWLKWLVSVRANRKMLAYFLCISFRVSIWVSSSKSTVLDPLPNFSEISCLVHLKVLKLQCLMVSSFVCAACIVFGIKSPPLFWGTPCKAREMLLFAAKHNHKINRIKNPICKLFALYKYSKTHLIITKSQRKAILLCYQRNLLYPISLQHVIKLQEWESLSCQR